MTTLLVFGASGVVGRAVVDQALQDPRISAILTVTRRPMPARDPRLQSLAHGDFTHFESLASRLGGVSACVYALGMAWPRAKTEAEYREVTFEYAAAAARMLASAAPTARFCFVSGHGADRDSRQTWARIKAQTEDVITGLYGANARIFRPGYIYPVAGRETPYWGDAVMRPLMPFRRSLARYITDSETVARALVHVALGGDIPSPASNADIQKAASEYMRCEWQTEEC